MEERIVESRKAFPQTQLSLPSVVEQEMAEGTWLARHQLMKPVQVSQVDWTTTQARGTDIVSLAFPQVLANQESLVLRTLRMYAFYKISPIFRVQINATVFHQGQLICSFDPFDICSTEAFDYDFSIYYATGLPNVKIMASFSDAVELKIPYIHPRSFLTTNTDEAYNTLGRFRISIINPLLAAEGASSSLTVTTWIYASQAQVHVPIQDHTPILSFASDDSVEATSLISGAADIASNLLETGKEKLGTVFDEGKNLLQGGQQLYGNLMSGNIGQALRTGQGLIDSLGKIFGFDYPARTLQPPKTISSIENLAITKGVSQSQRLGMDPFALHSLPDEVASESIEAMNLKSLVCMPMLLTQFVFNSTQTRGTLLKSIPVNPCVSHWDGSHLNRTYLSYVSNAFTYWSGGIVYDIEVIATKFHSGKLIFAYIPNTLVEPDYSAVSDSLPNVVIDIQQSSSVQFIVPFTSSTALKNTFATGTLVDRRTGIIDTCTGVLACYVQNTLAYASNVAPSVEINIYISAAKDFSLFVPQRPVLDLPEPVEATSLLLDTNKNESQSSPVSLAFGQGISRIFPRFGEDYSLFDLVKRFSPCERRAFTTTGEDPTQLLVFQVNPLLEQSYLRYWSLLYSCWSGSIRYKFVALTNRSTTAGLQATHLPTMMSARAIDNEEAIKPSDVWGLAAVRTQLSQDNALEIEIPFYSKYSMLITTINEFAAALIPPIGDLVNNGMIALQCVSTEPQDLSIDVYTAAGDDFRLIYPRPPPIDRSPAILKVTGL